MSEKNFQSSQRAYVGKTPPCSSTSKKSSQSSVAVSMTPPCARPIIRSTLVYQPPQTDPPHPPSLAAESVDVPLPTTFQFLRQNTVTPATVAGTPGPSQCSEPAGRSEPTIKVEERAVHNMAVDVEPVAGLSRSGKGKEVVVIHDDDSPEPKY
ncbi:hypothetical protein V8E53_003992 [Lactarius tabidus]